MILENSFLHVTVLTLVGVVTIVGFYAGRLARRVRLPALIGYMLLGVFLGPSALHLVDEPTAEQLSFITNIALGLVAFSIGAELSLSSLRRLGSGVISIIFAESLGVSLWWRRRYTC